MVILLLPLVTTFLYYLGAAARVTLPLRALLPGAVNEFLVCPACSGFWYGLAVGIYVQARHLSGLPPEVVIIGTAAASSVWTPYGAALLLRSLTYSSELLESTVDHDDVQEG